MKLKTLSDPCSPTGITADSCVQGNIVLVLSGRKLERRVEILLVAYTSTLISALWCGTWWLALVMNLCV